MRKMISKMVYEMPPIHLSFLAFRQVRELFRGIANQSLYTSHNIFDFIHLCFCEKLDEKLDKCTNSAPLWCLVKTLIAWREWQNVRWEKWLARWFTKCHPYTSRLFCFANIFSRSCQFNNKCIAGFNACTNLTNFSNHTTVCQTEVFFLRHFTPGCQWLYYGLTDRVFLPSLWDRGMVTDI